MSALLITIPISFLLAGAFVWFFIWSANNGQLDDVEKNKNVIFNNLEGKKHVVRKKLK